jgi:hypothetical protein
MAMMLDVAQSEAAISAASWYGMPGRYLRSGGAGPGIRPS